MSRGGTYNGSHTKIFLSEDGTIWPEDPKKNYEKLAKRWSIEHVEIKTPDMKAAARSIKSAKLQYLAQLAKLYRSDKIARSLPIPPRELWLAIHGAGSVVDWINNDRRILELFWGFVENQNRSTSLPQVIIKTNKSERNR